MKRELSADDVQEQACALEGYLAKPGNRGATFWLSGKDFTPADRAAILVALADREWEAPMMDFGAQR